MPRLSLTRRVVFAAAHRYRRPEWSEERNNEVFGTCARLPWHGHTYTCDVSVTGPVDAMTGFVVDLRALDEILAREVMARFDHRTINTDVPGPLDFTLNDEFGIAESHFGFSRTDFEIVFENAMRSRFEGR